MIHENACASSSLLRELHAERFGDPSTDLRPRLVSPTEEYAPEPMLSPDEEALRAANESVAEGSRRLAQWRKDNPEEFREALLADLADGLTEEAVADKWGIGWYWLRQVTRRTGHRRGGREAPY